ncbi:MAG TPA: exosortase H [Candidatus Competibacteraceae bacterium]|nr:exosortase H [Candidatus Competibacteraceae bacterium]
MRRYFVLFGVILLLGYISVYLPPVREHLVGPFTAGITQVAGALIALCGGQVWVSSNTLAIPGFAVQVLDMCNGVEATLVLWSAMLAFPAPWRYKLKGLALGTTTVHALNILRIISLLYLGAYDAELFHWFHWYLWDAVIMLDILVVFLAWLRWAPAVKRPGEPLAA